MTNTFEAHKKHAGNVFNQCTVYYMTYGGRCLNCGFDPDPQATKRIEKAESVIFRMEEQARMMYNAMFIAKRAAGRIV